MLDITNLSPEAIRECVEALRYLRRDFDRYGHLDSINMESVDHALTRVDLELSVAAVRRPIEAEG